MKISTAEKIKNYVQKRLGEKDAVIADLKKELEVAKDDRGNKFVMNVPENLKIETPKVQKVAFEHGVKVENLNEIKIPNKLEITNFPEWPVYPKEISINNLPKQKEVQKVEITNKENNNPPMWLDSVLAATLTAVASMFAKTVSALGKMIWRIALPDDFYTRPIPMVQIDRNTGKPLNRKDYQPIVEVMGGGGGGGGLTKDDRDNLKKIADNTANTTITAESINLNTDTLEAKLDATGDPLAPYKIADSDETGTPAYYGFTDAAGKWYILQAGANSYRYFAGNADYVANWANRAALVYDYYQNIF